MKPSSLGYLLKEGFRNIWQNSFMSIASVLVLISCLLLTGVSYLCFVNIDNIFDWVNDQNVALVFAADGATDDQVTALGAQLATVDNVATVEFLSKESQLESLRDSIPPATFAEMQGENNPCLDAYKITFENMAVLEDTQNQILTLSHVDSVASNVETAQMLTRIREVIMTIAAWVIGLLLLVSLFIISNTIKLTVYSRRLEIGIMKSVGATKSFIRLPFIVEGIVLGFFASILSFGILFFVYNRLETVFTIDLDGRRNTLAPLGMTGMTTVLPVWLELLLGFILIGLLTGIVGSAISVARYLKEDSGHGE